MWATLGSWASKIFLEFLWKKVMAFIRQAKKDQADAKEVDAQVAQDMKKESELKPSSTIQEQRDAADESMRHF